MAGSLWERIGCRFQLLFDGDFILLIVFDNIMRVAKFRLTILELLVVVAIAGILFATFFTFHHHRPRQVEEQELFGYWIAIPEAHTAFRLFLTSAGSGWLGSREIHTNLYRVTTWHVTNRDVVIDLANVTEPTLPREYIRGQVGFGELVGVRGGVNQNGEHWKRDIIFYREKTVLEDLSAAAAVMTNQSQIIRSEANRTPSASDSPQ